MTWVQSPTKAAYGCAVSAIQEGDYSWQGEGEGRGVRVGGHIRERNDALVLEGFIGNRQVSTNIAVVDNSLSIFTPVD